MVCCISYQRQLLYKMLSFCALFINEDKNHSEAMAQMARYILSGLDKVLKIFDYARSNYQTSCV